MPKVLSICIPTYNRKEQLIPDIEHYLSLREDRFQLIISDNCSTDGTKECIESIKDPRLIYIRKDFNIGGPSNLSNIMDFSDAEYNLILLDKDFINIEYLPEFIDFLIGNKPSFGLIDLNYHGKLYFENYRHGYAGIKLFGYKCFHPSGVFIKNSIWKEERNEGWMNVIPKDFDFYFDSLFSIIAEKYNGLLVKLPLITMSFIRGVRTGKSLTYDLDNLYFLPKNVLKNMKVFLHVNNIGSVDIKYLNYGNRMILRNTLKRVSYEYRYRMRTKRHEEHYGIVNRDIGFYEMFSNILKTRRKFRRTLRKQKIRFNRIVELFEVTRSIVVSFIIVVIDKIR